MDTSGKDLSDPLWCRVVELLLELLSTTLSRVLDSLPLVLMTPATLPPTGWGFLCADGAHYSGDVLRCSAAHRGLRAKRTRKLDFCKSQSYSSSLLAVNRSTLPLQAPLI